MAGLGGVGGAGGGGGGTLGLFTADPEEGGGRMGEGEGDGVAQERGSAVSPRISPVVLLMAMRFTFPARFNHWVFGLVYPSRPWVAQVVVWLVQRCRAARE